MVRQFLDCGDVFLAINTCVRQPDYPNGDLIIDYKKLMQIMQKLPIYEAEEVEDGA